MCASGPDDHDDAIPPKPAAQPASEPFVADFSEGLETGLYLALLELIDEGLIITSDETILEANSAACRLLERDYRDIAGKPLASLFTSEKAFLNARARLFIQGEMRGSLNVALPGRRQRAMRFIAAARIRPGVHAIILSPDLIAEAYAEREAPAAPSERQADTLWPRLAAALEQSVFVVDDGQRIAAVNAAAVNHLGIARDKLVGQPLTTALEVAWPQDGDMPLAQVRRLGQNPQPPIRARVLPGPKPGWRVLILPLTPPPATEPAPLKAPVAPPATARRQEGNPFERAFRDSPLPTFLCAGPQLRIFAANEAAARCYGYSRDALCALHMQALRAQPTDGTTPAITATSAGPAGDRAVWRQRTADGREFDVEILAYPIHVPEHADAMVLMHAGHNVPPRHGDRPDDDDDHTALPDEIASAARQAIDLRQLALHFQPLVDIRDGRIRNGEALLRWQHPQLGLLPFHRFMHAARSGGLIAHMGDWVLREATRHAAGWQHITPRPPGLAVNVAVEQLRHGALATRVKQALDDSGLEAGQLELDLDEAVLHEDSPRFAPTLGKLHALGIRLTIEGFGERPAILPRLKRYPLSGVKLDPSLVLTLGKRDESEAVVEAVGAMARIFGLEVLARGVATRAQQSFLSALGCHLQQGPLFGPSLPAAEFLALLERNQPKSR